jgi:hypothetical protein
MFEKYHPLSALIIPRLWLGSCGYKIRATEKLRNHLIDMIYQLPDRQLPLAVFNLPHGNNKKGAKIMKCAKFIIILMLALIGAISDSYAIKLCQLDWLTAWRNLGSFTNLSNYRYSYSRGNYNSSHANNDLYGDGGIGTWAITSDQGSPGVYHTVSGQSYCSSNNGSNTYTNGSPSFSTSSSADNKNCWCRMTTPHLGASWVFSSAISPAAYCAYHCANYCADCVRVGMNVSCTRSAVLELPK